MRVLIGDSNEIFSLGLKSLVASVSNYELVNCVKSSAEVISEIKQNETDILIIDYTAKNFTIDIIPQALLLNQNLKVLAITPEQSAQTLVHALRSGVTSYVKKDCDTQEIIDALAETARGEKFFCGQILETIRDASIDVEEIDPDAFSCEPISISEREVDIIVRIAEGFTNQQIAEELFLSNHTVNTHRKNILAKLGVKNTAGIVMYAVKTNLISPNKFLFAVEN